MRVPVLHTNGSWVSGGRSVRGGIRAFLLGADPRGRVLSGDQRSKDGGGKAGDEAEEDDKEWKEGSDTGGGFSADTVREPGRKDKQR